MMSQVQNISFFSLPAEWGGLGVFNPTEMAARSFAKSRCATDVNVWANKGKDPFELDVHISQ